MADRTTPDAARRRAYRRGHRAEAAAALLFRLKGFRVLARRMRTPLGEIDLIVHRGSLVVFAEVKQRARNAPTLQAISSRQQARIVSAARYWLDGLA